jgi:zinc transport system ATP-binding protein
MALIKAESLALGYDNGIIVKDLDFEVNAGDYLCIVGENGSGKSTLMRTLLGLQNPKGGRIILGDGLTKKEVGYLPQQNQVQKDFPASVREIVISGCQARCGLRPFYNREEKELAEKNMERQGITDLSARSYRELSGGQQQRVAIARAMVKNPKLLLCDELTGALDTKSSRSVLRFIEKINRQYGTTTLIITHNEAIANLADTVVRIRDGKIASVTENNEKLTADEIEL